MDLCLEITDDFAARNETVKRLYEHACRWLDLAIGRAPIEMQTILQVCSIVVSRREVRALIVLTLEIPEGISRHIVA